MGVIALYIFLLTGIGYFFIATKNRTRSKLKPISGVELTYSSAIFGCAFFVLGYLVNQLFDWKEILECKHQWTPSIIIDQCKADFQYSNFLFGFIVSCIFTALYLVYKSTFVRNNARWLARKLINWLVPRRFWRRLLSFEFFRRNPEFVWEGDTDAGQIWGSLVSRQRIVILFLSNGKCYKGRLFEVEVSERVPTNERLITLIVFASGFRQDNGVVAWDIGYDQPLKHHFYMNEVVNFTENSPGATFRIPQEETSISSMTRKALAFFQ